MKVSVIGTGYVGLVSGTCFAEFSHDVTCIDIDESKIEQLKQGKPTIYEPGLSDMITRNIEAQRLHFSTNYESVQSADVIFLAVGTPSGDDGEANLDYLMNASVSVAKNIKDKAVIVIKSTVPVGTFKKVEEAVSATTDKTFYIVNNPEFLKEGTAVSDFMKPDRVVLGLSDEYAGEIMEELYSPLVKQGRPLFKMNNVSAEMSKYAANCFLATKISFINEIARLCDLTGADIDEVRKGITSDVRIGPHFLFPGIGYGGSCFPKDVKALIHTAKDLNMDLKIVNATEEVNYEQKRVLFHKIMNQFNGKLKGKTFTFWGVAFKPNTDDIREAPALTLASLLNEQGANVQYYDPVASDNFEKEVPAEYTTRFNNKYEALVGSDALVIVTDWAEFRTPDFEEIASKLNSKLIFDGRNILDMSKVNKNGFQYIGIGKSNR